MKITLDAADRITVSNSSGALTIEAPDVSRQYQPFDMLASALGVCTHAVLSSWAQQAKLDASGLVIRIHWTVNEQHRMSAAEVAIDWPGLPPERLKAAERAAALCSIHQTLHHPPELTIRSNR